MGTADGISFLSASTLVDKRRQVYQSTYDYDYFTRHFDLNRVLTFNDAGLGQCSLSGRHFGLRLRGGSRLLSGWRGSSFRHRYSRFIPSQDMSVDFLQSTQAGCQSRATTTSSTTREDSILTSSTGLPSRLGR
jgi:hypothetical protein